MYPVSQDLARALHAERTESLRRFARRRRRPEDPTPPRAEAPTLARGEDGVTHMLSRSGVARVGGSESRAGGKA